MSIEEKFKVWFSKFTRLGLTQGEIWHVALGFENGYELAQKEMQEKLDAAIEHIRALVKSEEYSTRGEYIEALERARDFLKARG